ncbi:MAG TPA: carotenoid biosynthesis protein [Herpetosiphonaceae bacterium]
MSSVAYLFLEVSTLALFGLTIWHARRRGRIAVFELISAAIYGILLEWGDIVIFKTYSYSPGFWVAIGPVPIIIGLCWGLIIYGAMAYSDQLGLPVWAAPFADALWAIILDLAFDAIAIRLQLWSWTIPLSAGYFGVPADNFFAWLFVALSFSAYARWIRRHTRVGGLRAALQLAAPIAAFIGLLLGIWLFKALAAVLYPAGIPAGGGLSIFAGALAVFAAIVGLAIWRQGVRVRPGIDLIPTLTRWAMHGYFLGWAMLLALIPELRLTGMDLPAVLIGVAVALLVVEGLLLLPLLQQNRRFWRQVVVIPKQHPIEVPQADGRR